MPFEPRTQSEILQALAARLVARGALTDVAEGGAIHTLLQTVAEEIAVTEQRIEAVRDSFLIDHPNLPESMVDERLAELPGAGTKRLAASAASGSVMALSRATTDVADELTIPAGAVFRRSDRPDLLYRTTQANVFAIGVSQITGVAVTCLLRGTDGNCPAGAINEIVSAHARIVAAINTTALTSGQDAETAQAAQARGKAYLSSLAKSQRAALAYAALSYTAADGSRVRFAATVRDYSRAGYTELVVDDGTGMAGLVRAGQAVTGTVPVLGQTLFWHEAPAVDPIVEIRYVSGGVPGKLLAPVGDPSPDFVSIPELGIVVVPPGALAPGDTWEISGYQVRTGIIAELQREIAGDPSLGADGESWMAEGTRVVVRPPDVLLLAFDLWIVPRTGVAFATVAATAVAAAVAHLATLPPGEPLYVSRLVDALHADPDLLTVQVRATGTTTALDDVYPQTRQAVRTSTGLVATLPTKGV